MIGLKWYQPRAKDYRNFFCRTYVAVEIARIAGGNYRQYLGRAGRMIKAAKARGYIEAAPGCVTYYRFVDK